MPSVNVPLAGQPGWDTLQKQRKTFWAKENRDKLTAHFARPEFDCNDGSLCPTSARPAMVRLCRDFLEPLRAKFGTCHVLSGYRHELYNARIGGARHSQHIYEQGFESVAADLRFKRGTPAMWAAEAKKLRAKAGGNGGIGTYPRQGFLHVDNRSYRADWSG
jgi:peptidase M15-like protein